MKISEEDLSRAQHLALGELGLLDLYDELGTRKYVRSRGGDGSSGGTILGVVHTNAVPGIGLDDHLVARADELADPGRHETHPILMNLDLSRDTDTHETVLD
jgi:hypothetical protein